MRLHQGPVRPGALLFSLVPRGIGPFLAPGRDRRGPFNVFAEHFVASIKFIYGIIRLWRTHGADLKWMVSTWLTFPANRAPSPPSLSFSSSSVCSFPQTHLVSHLCLCRGELFAYLRLGRCDGQIPGWPGVPHLVPSSSDGGLSFPRIYSTSSPDFWHGRQIKPHMAAAFVQTFAVSKVWKCTHNRFQHLRSEANTRAQIN